MRHYQAKVSAGGQLTIPAAIREAFGLKTGDIVDFYVDDAGRSVTLLARNKSIFERLDEFKLPSSPNGRPVTVAEMDDAIGDYPKSTSGLAANGRSVTRSSNGSRAARGRIWTGLDTNPLLICALIVSE